MPRPTRREAVANQEAWYPVEGPLEDPRAVLVERLVADRTLLDDIEVVYGAEASATRPDIAAADDDESLAERAAEAERLVHIDAPGEEDGLTPESLVEVLEPFPTATDQTLHEVEPLLEALLDEGTPLDTVDPDAVEAEIAGGAWRDYVD